MSFIGAICAVCDEVAIWVHFGDAFSVVTCEGVVRTPGWRHNIGGKIIKSVVKLKLEEFNQDPIQINTHIKKQL